MTSVETEARNLTRRWQDRPSLKQCGSPRTPPEATQFTMHTEAVLLFRC